VARVYSDNAISTLSADILAADTNIPLITNAGFQTVTGDEYETIAITDGVNVEIAHVTAKGIDNYLTVLRAQEGSSAHDFLLGASVYGSLSAQAVEEFRDGIYLLQPLSGIVTPVGVITPDYVGQLYVDTVAIKVYTAKALTSSDWKDTSGAAPLTGSGTPEGVVFSEYAGQLYIDVNAEDVYISTYAPDDYSWYKVITGSVSAQFPAALTDLGTVAASSTLAIDINTSDIYKKVTINGDNTTLNIISSGNYFSLKRLNIIVAYNGFYTRPLIEFNSIQESPAPTLSSGSRTQMLVANAWEDYFTYDLVDEMPIQLG